MRLGAGFSLVELMVVLVVIALTMLAAVPAVQERETRKQIEESFALAQVAQQPVAAAWALGMPLPSDNAAAGLPSSSKMVSGLVSSVEVEHGAIHITYGNQSHTVLHGKVLSLRPAVVTGSPVVPIAWVCGYADAPGGMSVSGANRTTIKANLLPFQCRGKTKK